MGMAWRVGDGSKIGIWKDKWVCRGTVGHVQTPIRILAHDAKVSELSDAETNWWNTALIHEIFGPEEATSICGLAISPRNGEDRLYWTGTHKGNFSVRSAYHMAKEGFEVDMGSCSNRETNRGLWKKIWASRVPPTVKNFLWKACDNILATKENLFKKHVTNDPMCLVCKLEAETVSDILWVCPSTRDVWSVVSGKISKTSSENLDFMSIMEKLLNRLSEEEMTLATIIARQLWLRRNVFVHEGKFSSPQVVYRKAQEQLHAHLLAESNAQKHRLVQRHPTPMCWMPPPVNFHKVNWDVAVDRDRCRVGLGVIIRDSDGRAKAMMCETKEFIQDPATGQALAARRGVELSIEMGLSKVVLEGDALEVVGALCNEDGVLGRYGPIIQDIKASLGFFQDVVVQHVKRDANGEAHRLAKLALTFEDNRVWREDFPISL